VTAQQNARLAVELLSRGACKINNNYRRAGLPMRPYSDFTVRTEGNLLLVTDGTYTVEHNLPA
jgi:hypothetical protein